MQQDAQNAKQLLVERVRQSTNILVAVSSNPSVDALSASLGLALMLNKMDKHATAVFSGAVPPAIDFLQPGKTFEHTVDSLRDFIISLDKDKADRLRYKVEDDVVRIFITPYRTTLTEKDLQFSQGDFNVDLILALGVEKREELDKAIVAHGRILHDATVMTINANNQQNNLGAVDWHDPNASSLSEMLVSLSEAFQQPGILDAQIATALLTGIVAATDRFSNERTNPRVMTMSAQLMAAGANQQLIANNLTKAMAQPIGDGKLAEGAASIKVADVPPPAPKEKGELDIDHPKKGDKNQQTPEQALEAALPAAGAAASSFNELKTAIEGETPPSQSSPKKAQGPKFLKEPKRTPGSEAVSATPEGGEGTPAKEEGYAAGASSWRGRRLEAPSMGGTLNATTEEAMDDALKAEEEERNHKILSHDAKRVNESKVVAAPAPEPPPPAPEPTPVPAPAPEPEPPVPAPPVAPVEPPPAPEPPAPEPPVEPPVEPTPPVPPAPQPEPTPEPVPIPEPAPEPAPAPPSLLNVPEPTPLPPPPAPEPLAPAPEPVPEPPVEPAPSVDEALAAAQPAHAVGADLDAARQAVTDALSSQPFNPAGQPLQSTGAMPLGMPSEAAPMAEPAPVPQPSVEPPTLSTSPLPPPPSFEPAQASDASAPDALPPLPPMPPLPQQDPGQPLPPPPSLNDLPPLPSNIPPAPITPPVEVPPEQPPAAPADPGQFQIPGAPKQ
jgi:hypothetical protein